MHDAGRRSRRRTGLRRIGRIGLMGAVLLAGTSGAATGGGGPAQGERVCPDPDACRLSEAGAVAGVRFGFHNEGGPGAPGDAILVHEADTVTNHGVSWRSLQPAPGVVTASMDANCAFAETHDLFQVGYHFAWDQFVLDDLADWVLAIDDPAALRAVLRERVRIIFEGCPGIDRLDVVNEPLVPLDGSTRYPSHFANVLGPDYIEELLRIVRDEAPDGVELFVNENFVEYFPDRAAAFVELVREVVESGAPIDAVGLQTHLLLGEPIWDLYRWTLDELAALGVKVFVTELDVPVPPDLPDRYEVQAERYRRVVEACLAVPACDTIIVWGIDDAHTWLDSFDILSGPDPNPLLFDDTLQAKPAYFAVKDALLRGRGGAHPIAGDRLRAVRAARGGSLLSVTSRDPGVVTPSPGSRNDPIAGDPGEAALELRLPDGRAWSAELESGRWRVAAGTASHWSRSGSRRGFTPRSRPGPRVRLHMVEGESLRLLFSVPDLRPSDLADGATLRLVLGTLRTCLSFGPDTVVKRTPSRLVAEHAPRPPGFDCSLTP